MAHHWTYRRDLKARARSLRRDASMAERKLWHDFLSLLPVKFTRQKPLGRYIADFYCASHRLVIELDGDSHFSDQAERYDASRSAYLASLGIAVLRLSNDDVLQNFASVCERIDAELAKS